MFQQLDAGVADYEIRQVRLCVPFSITFHATPASKVHASDLPSALVLSTEGKTSTASGIDSGCSFTTEADSTGIFGILVYGLGEVKKVLKAEVVHLSSGTAALSLKGASTTGVTASKNIAVSVDWSGDLSTTTLSAVLCLDYNVANSVA